jgi:NAD(P)-dependent dehydrogenase (short-subunit alcohol dehydrogenase family)
MERLRGKVAIVTGAGRGIGRGIARAFAAEGAEVVVASRSQKTVDEVVREIRADGGTAHGLTVDVGDRASVFEMVARSIDVFGSIDILVNNAQGFGPASKPASAPIMQPLESFDEDEWEHTFRTGVQATLWGMKAVFPHMRGGGGGKIINFASEFGIVGTPGAAAYNSNKEAIRGLSRTAAREWGQYGINVNVITPMVRTDAMETFERADPDGMKAMVQQIPMRRFGDPQKDAGPVAVFLASAESDYLTGMNMMLDGGHCMYP